MKKFAVAYINNYDNELTIEFVEAATWREAIILHNELKDTPLDDIPQDLEEAKVLFFNQEAAFDVKEIV